MSPFHLVGETSHLLAHDNNMVYNVAVNSTHETSTSETADEVEKLYCPGKILHLIERYDSYILKKIPKIAHPIYKGVVIYEAPEGGIMSIKE